MDTSIIDFINNSKYLSLHRNNLLEFLIDLTPIVPSNNYTIVLSDFNRCISINKRGILSSKLFRVIGQPMESLFKQK